jgi:hypothetical protein
MLQQCSEMEMEMRGFSDSAVKRDSDSAGSEGVLMLQEEELRAF